ncbi:mitochondrial inner membrane magnesium transporter mrs2 [Lasiosphaeris hirsuta]|uniref:Magnesium transporter n=1 Tax=Lasiosphaeris hirsuta TaxID=260670 RepID=A0AA40B8Z6_9PEZI|nr:mitochondrial inner membrane magnesium transporter mrs2 [Lasiosphaeris hirsuta]
MPPALKLGAAPSQTLLRFLRAQSEGVSFFTGAAECVALRRHSGNGRSRPPPARPLSTSSAPAPPNRNPGILQATLWDVETILPKSFRKQRTVPGTSRARKEGIAPSLVSAQRYSSSEHNPEDKCHPKWQDWLFGSRNRRREQMTDEDLRLQREEASGSIFPRRSLTAKAALDPRLRCTEVDGNGDVITVDGELKKSELIAKYGLLPRDLRKIDSSNLPHILVRPSAILLNLLHLKVLIKHDRVLLFDVYGSTTSYSQSAFMYDLQGKLQQKQGSGANSLPYEFRALEAVLMSVTSELEADFEAVRDPVIGILSELEDDIDRENLRILLVLSKRVSTFEQKSRLVRDAIEELLEADDDLSAMYLTEKTHDLFRGEGDHTEVELLLESYNKICDEVVQEASNLVSSIKNTEEMYILPCSLCGIWANMSNSIRAILDANRNSLMLLDLKFSVGALGLAVGTFLAGLYGMNLENFIEETNWGFSAVTGLSTAFSLLVCWYGLAKLRKVQRVKMGGGALRHGDRNHWFHNDSADALLDPSNRERLRRINMLKQTAAKQTKRKWF